MKKHLLSLMCAAIMLVSAAGCASYSKASTATGASSPTAEQSTSASEAQTTATVPTEQEDEPVVTTTQTSAAEQTTAAPETSVATSAPSEQEPEATTASTTTSTEPSVTTSAAATTTATTAATTTATTITTTTTAATTTTAPKENEPKPVVAAKTYEAEDAKLSGGLSVVSSSACSGGAAVERFENDSDYITFSIEIPVSGAYDITFVASGIGSYKENNAYIDGTHIGMFSSESGTFTSSVIPTVSLSKGTHELRITKSWKSDRSHVVL